MKEIFFRQSSVQRQSKERRSGMTLTEVVVAMALVSMISGVLLAMGMRSRALTEHNRIATEARSLAKERLEEMLSLGFAELAKPSCTITNQDTQLSSQGHLIVRQPVLIWHAANADIVNPGEADYVEAHVQVTFISPSGHKSYSDSYGVIISR